jgi:hypothetical protein
MIEAAIGLRSHTGWATLVVIGRAPSALLDRRRLELLAPDVPGQLYHDAAEREFGDAAEFVARTIAAVDALAAKALRKVLDEQRARGRNVIACGLSGTQRATPPLAATLASHARIHAAEGDLFRNALTAAAELAGLPLVTVPEKDVAAATAHALGITPSSLQRHVAEIGHIAGAPWRSDQKLATMAAMLALVRPGGPAAR